MSIFGEVKSKLLGQARQALPPEAREAQTQARKAKTTARRGSQAMSEIAAEAKKHELLAKRGKPGQAIVKAMRETGAAADGKTQIELDVSVRSGGGQPYDATFRELVPTGDLPRYQPGTTLAVRVDPEDRQSLTVI